MVSGKEIILSMKRIAILFSIFILMVILAADLGVGSPFFALVRRVPGADKTGHFILIGLLAFFVIWAVMDVSSRSSRSACIKSMLVLAAIITLEELTQLFLRFRGFSYADLAFDYLGILLFGCLAAFLQRRQSRHTRLAPEAAEHGERV